MKIVFGGTCSNSINVAEELARALDADLGGLEVKRFPDEETYVRILNDVKGKHVIYVQSTAPPQDTCLVELFITLDTFRRLKAKRIDVIIPYLAYARQDKEFKRGEAISARTVAKILNAIRVDRLYTLDVHLYRRLGPFSLYGVKAYNLSAGRALARYVKSNLGIEAPATIIPDRGHTPLADMIRDIVGDHFVFLRKRRKTGWEYPKIYEKTADLQRKDVVIFDDILGTGGTILKATQFALAKGAKRVVVAVTHALFIDNARERLREAGVSQIVTTDSILQPESVIPIAPIMAEYLKSRI